MAKRERAARRVTFRVALLTLLLGLLVLTVTAIVIVGAITSARSVEDLEERYLRATSMAVGGEVRPYLEPAVIALADTRDQALAGRVQLDSVDDLGRFLAARLRHLPSVAWLSYSDDATGRFVGVWRRDDGAIVRNHSDPRERKGQPAEVVFQADGSTAPLERNLPEGYDPRPRPWYRNALAAEGVTWTEPFMFNEGRPGITAALGVRPAAGGAPVGVLTADFFLDGLSGFLNNLAGADGTAIEVTTRTGAVVAQSHKTVTCTNALCAAVEAAPQEPGALSANAAISWRFAHDDVPHAAGARIVRVAGGGEWAVIVAVPEAQFLSGVEGNRRVALGAAAGFLVLSLLLGWLLANRVARPLGTIADDLERVARFDLAGSTGARSHVKEIAVVIDAADRMKASLRSFSRYVPTDVVRDLLARGVEARLGGSHRTLTILFADAVGFTSLAESMEPALLAEHLGEFLEATSSAVRLHHGTIDKFMGDGVLAFFNAPADVPDHAAEGCRAALEAQRRLKELGARWAAQGRPVLNARIGLHVGNVIVGNLGTPERFGYTIVGDAANLASRIEGLNRRYGTKILVSGDARAAAGPAFEWRAVDRVSVAGREGVTDLYELLGETGRTDAVLLQARDVYEAALRRLQSRDFAGARSGFAEAARLRPGDKAADALAARAQALHENPPPADWRGALELAEK